MSHLSTPGSTLEELRRWATSSSNNHSGLDQRQWNALIGIVTAIVGNILISFALNLQRYAHIQINRDRAAWEMRSKSARNLSDYGTQAKLAEQRAQINLKTPAARGGIGVRGEYDETTPLNDGRRPSGSSIQPAEIEEEKERNKTYLRSPWWWAGIILMTIGEAGNFLAYGFAPASLVSPLGVVALISNCIIAPCLLKEHFRHRDFWGVLVAVGGVVTLVLSSKGSEDRMGPGDIKDSITRWEFMLYLGLTASTMLALVWASSRYGHKTLLIDLGLVGLFGGYTALCTKGIASLLSDRLWLALTYPITYILILILVATALLQIRYLNRALSRFNSTQVIPTQFVMFTISVIVGSAVLYRDFESAGTARVEKFIGGCALTFLGVYMITSGRKTDDGTDDLDPQEGDAEESVGFIDEEEDSEEMEQEEQGPEIREPDQTSSDYGFPGSRRSSQLPSAHASTFPRRGSSRSQVSRPYTPPSPSPGSPLLENPWAAASREDLRPFRQSSHNTNNSLPATPGTPPATLGTPSRRPYHTSHDSLSRHRRSIADILPGPITHPLSSSFSGIVAHSAHTIRKESESTPSKRRRPRLGLRKSKSSKLQGDKDVIGRQVSAPPSAQLPEDDRPELHLSSRKRTRSTSLGDALGSFFHRTPKKKARDEEDARPRTEDGPGGG